MACGDGGEVAFQRGLGAFDAAWVARADSRATSALVFAWSDWELETTPAFCEFGVAGGIRLGEFGLRGIAGQGGLGLGDLRAVARDGGLGLAQGFLVRTRVDLEQQVALLTFWPSVKPTRSNCPATWDFTCTMAEASTVPTTRKFGRHGFLSGFGDGDRHGRRSGGGGCGLLLLTAGERSGGKNGKNQPVVRMHNPGLREDISILDGGEEKTNRNLFSGRCYPV